MDCFAEQPLNIIGPESQNTSIGSQVVFHCLLQNVPSGENVESSSLTWTINGSDIDTMSIDNYPHQGRENNSLVGNLTINLFKSEDIMWNNSKIVCKGFILQTPPNSSSISSPSALLRIQGMDNLTNVIWIHYLL